MARKVGSNYTLGISQCVILKCNFDDSIVASLDLPQAR